MATSIIIYPLEEFLKLSNREIGKLSFNVPLNLIKEEPVSNEDKTVFIWGKEYNNYDLLYTYEQNSDNFAVIDLSKLPRDWRNKETNIKEHIADLGEYVEEFDFKDFNMAMDRLYEWYPWINYFYISPTAELGGGDISISRDQNNRIKGIKLERIYFDED